MPRRFVPLALAALAAAAVFACTPSPAALNPVPAFGPEVCDSSCAGEVVVKYLGVGGFYIRHGKDAILTAPFFTTPRLSEVVHVLSVKADTARIRERMDFLLPDPADRSAVRAILVGHSHYDHLMDVPHVARTVVPDPAVRIWGDTVTRRLLAFDPEVARRVVEVDDSAGSFRTPGRWIYPHPGGTVRFMAVQSEHAPHVRPIKGFRRRQSTDRHTPPPTAWAWSEGKTHAFVIDFLADDRRTVRFRLYYQDAASTPPLGFPPPLEEGPRRFDVAILCAGSFGEVKGYPQGILWRTQPRYAVIGHWESFFQPQTDPLEVIPMTDAAELRRRVDENLPDGGSGITPLPGAALRFCTCPPEAPRS